jgi:hypothetical protein
MIPIFEQKPGALNSIDDFLVEDEERGDYRVHRSAFTDERLFELEMKTIFEGIGFTWHMKARSRTSMIFSQLIWVASPYSLRVIGRVNLMRL